MGPWKSLEAVLESKDDPRYAIFDRATLDKVVERDKRVERSLKASATHRARKEAA